MNIKLQIAKNILTKYNQQHLLNFYDDLSKNEKKQLLNQILNIDFNQILNLYDNSKKHEDISKIDITPLPHIEKNNLTDEQLEHYIKIGESIIFNNQIAVVTMAGGQGTRLGYKGPKGTYMLNLKPLKKSLFQLMAEDLINTNKKYKTIIPWYIMTSEENHVQTQDFFVSNDFFGYPKEKILFFKQDKLPIIDIEGKLILQEPYLIKQASNGNGNVFKAMKKII